MAGLARAVGLSRSALAERFAAAVGVPPRHYVTAWRLQAAARRLRETGCSVAQAAHAAGYASEEAFSRAFKRAYGEAPARWRGET